MRAYAVKLLFIMSQDGDKRKLAEHLGEKYMKCLAKLISTSSNEEEKAAAVRKYCHVRNINLNQS